MEYTLLIQSRFFKKWLCILERAVDLVLLITEVPVFCFFSLQKIKHKKSGNRISTVNMERKINGNILLFQRDNMAQTQTKKKNTINYFSITFTMQCTEKITHVLFLLLLSKSMNTCIWDFFPSLSPPKD